MIVIWPKHTVTLNSNIHFCVLRKPKTVCASCSPKTQRMPFVQKLCGLPRKHAICYKYIVAAPAFIRGCTSLKTVCFKFHNNQLCCRKSNNVNFGVGCIPQYLALNTAVGCIAQYLALNTAVGCIPQYLALNTAVCCIPQYLALNTAVCCIAQYLALNTAVCCIAQYATLNTVEDCVTQNLPFTINIDSVVQ